MNILNHDYFMRKKREYNQILAKIDAKQAKAGIEEILSGTDLQPNLYEEEGKLAEFLSKYAAKFIISKGSIDKFNEEYSESLLSRKAPKIFGGIFAEYCINSTHPMGLTIVTKKIEDFSKIIKRKDSPNSNDESEIYFKHEFIGIIKAKEIERTSKLVSYEGIPFIKKQ